MLMQRFIMLKMFLAAVGASSASMAAISVAAPEKFEKARAKVCALRKDAPRVACEGPRKPCPLGPR
jgi:hypothetical protein